MRFFKILFAGVIALLTLLLGLHILYQPFAETVSETPPSLTYSELAVLRRVDIDLWFMPDFAENRVWVDGEISGTADRWQQFVQDQRVISITASWQITGGYHIFGQWIDGQILTTSNAGDTAYVLQMPGLELQPADTLNIKLVSGLILSATAITAQAAPQVTTASGSPPAVSTGTLALRLAFTPASLLTATGGALTGSYTLDNPAFNPASGTFAVTSTVELTAGYTISTSSAPTSAGDLSTAAFVTPSFRSTFRQFGDFSQINLTDLTTRPITLLVEFYPYRKDINLSLTPLLVETMMTRTASAVGGAVFRNISGLRFVRAGLVGHGDIHLHASTIDTDAQRSAVALAAAFRRTAYDEKGGLPNRLLERTLDFPSFPFSSTVGESNRHKETMIQAVATEISASLPAGRAGFSLESNFQLNVWRRWYDAANRPIKPALEQTLAPDRAICAKDQPLYEQAVIQVESAGYPDFNRCIGGLGEQQVMQLGLGRIMLGPRDVLTLTMDNVAWKSIDPLPDALVDHWAPGNSGPERSGFTAVYSGAHSIDLNILYNPRPNLFARQAVAMTRGESRSMEYLLAQLVGERPLQVLVVVGVLVLWLLYQVTIPDQGSQRLLLRIRGKLPRVTHVFLRSVLAAVYLLALLMLAHLRSYREVPFEVLTVGGALLLFRWDTVFTRRGRYLWIILVSALSIDLLLNATYFSGIQSALKYGSASGVLSGATAIAILFELLGCLAVLLWQLNNRQLRLDDMQAFVFVGLAAATFDVQDASLFALVVLYLAWLAFSLLLDHVGPALKLWPDVKSGAQSAAAPPLPDRVGLCLPVGLIVLIGLFTIQQALDPQVVPPQWDIVKPALWAIAVLSCVWLAVSLLKDLGDDLRARADAPTNTPASDVKPPLDAAKPHEPPTPQPQPPASTPHGEGVAARRMLDRLIDAFRKLFGRPGAAPASVQPGAVAPPSPAPAPIQGPDTAKPSAPNGPLKPLTDRIGQFLQPVPIGALLIVAIVLSQDRLLRTQLVSFYQSTAYRLAWFLDPLGILAATLVPAVAVVLLMVFLDTALAHWRAKQPATGNRGLDVFVKALLPATLFLIFLLGSGGLDLFTGAIDLRLSDRIVYYVTVPLLTVMWLDRELPKQGDQGGLRGLLNQIGDNLTWGPKLIRTILIVLSILIPQLATSVSSEQFNQIIQTLQSLQLQ